MTEDPGDAPEVLSPKLLSGIRVLEFGQFMAAPHATLLLASLGAEVIKIERPRVGDQGRDLGALMEGGVSGFFIQQNWGKRSFSVDLKHPRGVEMVRKLCRTADVVVENYRPGALDRLGLGYPDLTREDPRLIMCSVSAFGQTGPYRSRPGYGPLVEALGGATDLCGEPDGPPMPTRYMIADSVAASHAFGAVCAALFDRSRTGKGQFIDISLFDCIIEGHELAFEKYYASGGKERMTRRGMKDDTVVPFGVVQVGDRYLAIHCATDGNWRQICRTIGRPQWETDPQFASNEGRARNHEEVYAAIEAWLASIGDAHRAVAIFQENGVPCELVQNVEEVANDPQVEARNMLVEREVPKVGRMKVVDVALRTSPKEAGLTGTPPFLGEHTEELASELGYSGAEIGALFDQGVLFRDPTLGNTKTGGQ